VVAVEFFDSTNPNIVRVLPAGVGGSQANQWANAPAATQFGGQAFISAVAPDLTVISLGINDDAAGRTASQILGDVNTLAARAKVSGDVLLMSAFPHPSATSLDAVNAAYLASTYPYVDLAFRYGYTMLSAGLMTTDQTHPNALGYGDAALTLSRYI
jgi:lysophospholipase L1-like esterase